MQEPLPEATSRTAPRGRTIAFRILAGLFGLLTVAFTIPFAIATFTDEQQEIHAYHNIGSGLAFSVVLGVGLLLAAWRPLEMLAPFQATFVASVLMAIAGLLADDLVSGAYFVGLLIAVVLIVLHPARRELWTLGRVRPSLLVLWIAWSVPAVAYAMTQIALQRDNPVSDPHVEFHHYSGAAASVLAVAAVALVTALGTRGTRAAGWLTGVAGAFLGVMSLAFSDKVSAFDAAWGWLAIVWAVAFVGLAEIEHRRDLP